MTQFRNEILAGTVLARTAIRSENYVAGSAGWQINRDGSAELNNLVARGTLQSSNFVSGSSGWRLQNNGSAELLEAELRGSVTVGDPTDTHIDITQDGVVPNLGSSNIRFNSGKTEEIEPAHLENQYAGGSDERSHIFLRGADIESGHGHPIIDLHTGRPDGTLGHDIQLIAAFGGTHPAQSRILLTADFVRIEDGNETGEIECDYINSGQMRPTKSETTTDQSITSDSTSPWPGTGIGHSFTAPPSGTIKVHLSARLRMVIDAGLEREVYAAFVVREGNTVGSGTLVQDADFDRAVDLRAEGPNETGVEFRLQSGFTDLVDGLTPGDTYNIEIVARVNATSDVTAEAEMLRVITEPTM